MDIGYRVIYSKKNRLEDQLVENSNIELNLRTSPREAYSARSEINMALQRKNVEVLSVHYPGDKSLDDNNSYSDLRRIFDMADLLDAKYVVLHPFKLSDMETKEKKQKSLLEKIELLRKEYKAEPCLETFAGSTRLFSPTEIIAGELPMVLDTSHLDYAESERIVQNYFDGIKVVHLSRRDLNKGLHLPIDSWCVELVQHLFDNNFAGNVILEYNGKEANTKMQKDYVYLKKMLLLRNSKNLSDDKLLPYLELLKREDVNEFDINMGLGIGYLNSGKVEDVKKAASNMEEATRQNPFSSLAFYLRGLSEVNLALFYPEDRLHFFAEAKKSFSKSLELSDTFREEIEKISL